jgi:cytochrome d ubiquinol oxidase subunit I
MLFGWNRVGRGVHFVATCLVAVGTLLSAFWIMAANSWMQTPAGFIHQNGRFYVGDWWAAIFNPSFPYRLVHMSLASLDTTSFVVAGVAAWYLLQRRHEELARKAFSLALWMAAIVAPLQIVAGDQSGLEVLRNQPVKLAAIEALWHDAQPAPFHVFAIPDDQAATNHFELSIPRAGSLILTHSWNGSVKGLDQVGPQDRPPVAIPFFAFRVMVAAGFLMLFVAWIALWLRYKGRLYSTRWYLWACIASMPLGYIATVAGWLVAEVGRQPWTVHGLLRTADSASAVATAHVGTSLALFVLFYCVLLGAWVFYGIRWVVQGPAIEEPPPPVRNVLRDRPMPAVR